MSESLDRPGAVQLNKSPGVYFAGVMVGLTLAGAVAGGVFGHSLLKTLGAGRIDRASEPVTKAHVSESSSTLYDLPPIITNLLNPPDAWVRIQASIVLSEQKSHKTELLGAQISEDILSFVRTLSLNDISGASGLQHLREDLNERALIRSDGHVHELILQTLVVQ